MKINRNAWGNDFDAMLDDYFDDSYKRSAKKVKKFRATKAGYMPEDF